MRKMSVREKILAIYDGLSLPHYRKCAECGVDFSLDVKDVEFYRQMLLPPPMDCSPCRLQRRLAHINLLNLYSRKCDLTGKPLLSVYPRSAPFPVYNNQDYSGGKWDPCQYGRAYDFSKSFFEQYAELAAVVPRPALCAITSTLVNSEYANGVTNLINCYLVFDSDFNENCYYSYSLQHSKECVDCLKVRKSELCYECVDCQDCYGCRYAQNVRQCRDLVFAYECADCSDNFGCVNLYHKKFCFFNQQLSEPEYRKKMAGIDLGSYAVIEGWRVKFKEHLNKFPQKAFQGINNEQVTGNYLYNSSQARDSFDAYGLENGRYCINIYLPIKDAYDCFMCGEKSSLLYENIMTGFSCYDIKFGQWIDNARNIEYSNIVESGCRDLFGCIGMNKKANCILNKQYSAVQYQELREKIILQMIERGEYGRFFPSWLSAHGYDQTLASIYFPLSKERVLEKGWRWEGEEREWERGDIIIPDNISSVGEKFTQKLLADEKDGRNYRITKQELEFYKGRRIPLPRYSFITRHRARLAQRTGWQIFKTTCARCAVPISTALNPGKNRIIYCNECFSRENR